MEKNLQKELLKKFASTLRKDPERHNPRESSWLDGVKKFFEGMRP